MKMSTIQKLRNKIEKLERRNQILENTVRRMEEKEASWILWKKGYKKFEVDYYLEKDAEREEWLYEE